MHSTTPDILAYSSTNKQEVLSQQQLDSLKAASLKLLEEVGVRFPPKKRFKSLPIMALM